MSKIVAAKNRGVTYVNVTPHEIRLAWPDGEDFTVPPSGVVVSAHPQEEVVTVRKNVTYVATRFLKDYEMLQLLDDIEEMYPDAVVIGSIIAAQAYPGRVVAMVPVPGFERVPPSQKKMRADKFTVFTG